ncbi:hypothetical protein [Dysosmobacter sp.]|uniref:hypothetical protein n=1 Tax=Dysosmobacter sp. TaxID=2591382 RepID=UPI002A8C9A8A|nr:hypothetical protein [Dysosmobacter sp.]MDY3281874.1 hypothetical protein [Dysosmobacter sp.]
MFQTTRAHQHSADTAARRSAAASCCANSADIALIMDAAFVASIFIVCLQSRITIALLALIVLIRLPLRSLTALLLQSPLS